MKNSVDLGGCYLPRPSASVDNTLLGLQNSSYPKQPHSIIAKYYLSGSELHSPADGRVRGRRFETHRLPVGGLNILRSKIKQTVQYSVQILCYPLRIGTSP